MRYQHQVGFGIALALMTLIPTISLAVGVGIGFITSVLVALAVMGLCLGATFKLHKEEQEHSKWT